MPAEKFYLRNQVEGDGQAPDLVFRWARPTDVNPGQVEVYGAVSEAPLLLGNTGDVTGLDRAITALKRARRAVLGDDHRAPCVDGSVCGEPAHCPPPETPPVSPPE